MAGLDRGSDDLSGATLESRAGESDACRLFAAGLVLGLAGVIIGKLRWSERHGSEYQESGDRGSEHHGLPRAIRDACLLFTASAVLVLVPQRAFATFDWHYQLTLIPVDAILGLNISRITSSSQRAERNPETTPNGKGRALACGGYRKDGGSSGSQR